MPSHGEAQHTRLQVKQRHQNGSTSQRFLGEVSPTSDINPPSPPDWKEGYAEFKHTKARQAGRLTGLGSCEDLMCGCSS